MLTMFGIVIYIDCSPTNLAVVILLYLNKRTNFEYITFCVLFKQYLNTIFELNRNNFTPMTRFIESTIPSHHLHLHFCDVAGI